VHTARATSSGTDGRKEPCVKQVEGLWMGFIENSGRCKSPSECRKAPVGGQGTNLPEAYDLLCDFFNLLWKILQKREAQGEFVKILRTPWIQYCEERLRSMSDSCCLHWERHPMAQRLCISYSAGSGGNCLTNIMLENDSLTDVCRFDTSDRWFFVVHMNIY